MYSVFEHKLLVFLSFLIPLLAWCIEKYLPKKAGLYVLIFSIALFTPILFGYLYAIEEIGIILLDIIAASFIAYRGLLVKKSTIAVMLGTLTCGSFMFLFVGFLSIVGTVRVDKVWRKGDHKIAYVIDQGFAGGPIRTYQLYEDVLPPVLIKHVEEKVDSDTTNNCEVIFEHSKFKFSKCSPALIEYHYEQGYSLF